MAVLGGGEWQVGLCKGLVAKQIVTAKVVAEFLQEAQDVGDAVDCWEVESVLFTVKHGCGIKETGLSMSAWQCRAAQGRRSPAHRLPPAYLITQSNQCPGCPSLPSPPSLKGLIFASNSKGLAVMGVARPGLLHRGSEVILLNL